MRRYVHSILVVVLLLTAGKTAFARGKVSVTVRIPQMIITFLGYAGAYHLHMMGKPGRRSLLSASR